MINTQKSIKKDVASEEQVAEKIRKREESIEISEESTEISEESTAITEESNVNTMKNTKAKEKPVVMSSQ